MFFCVVLAVLELSLWTRLTLNSLWSVCLYLPSAGMKGMQQRHLALLVCLFLPKCVYHVHYMCARCV